MTDFGVTPQGFNRKRLDTIINQLDAELRIVLGDDLNLEPESPTGQIVGVFGKALADLYETAEIAYHGANVNAATGAALSQLVQLGNVQRLQAAPTAVSLFLTGTPGAVIPAGSEAADGDGVLYRLSDTLTLDVAGAGSVDAVAVETGPQVAAADTITTISTPVAGWATVNNPRAGTPGTLTETDADLRARFIRTRSTAGTGTVDAIFAAVSNLSGVTQLRVLEDRTEHHISVIVQGGDDDEIAQAVWQNKPAGIATVGNTPLFLNDSQGNQQLILINRSVDVPIRVDIGMELVSDAEGDVFIAPGRIELEIQEALAAWPADNLGIGENMIATQLYTPLNEVAARYNIFSVKLTRIGGDNNLDVVELDPEEVGTIAPDDVNVLVI